MTRYTDVIRRACWPQTGNAQRVSGSNFVDNNTLFMARILGYATSKMYAPTMSDEQDSETDKFDNDDDA